MNDSDEIFFAEEEETVAEGEKWKILIADDEPGVHAATKIALEDFSLEGRTLDFLSAYSGEEAIRMLGEHSDIVLVLLDVVMETDDAGLRVVQQIREDMKNRHVRVILRTGQAGRFPEESVVVDYDINDYKTKTELTAGKLFTSVVTSIRSYNNIRELNEHREHLEELVEKRSEELRQKDLQLIEMDRIAGIGTLAAGIAHEINNPLSFVKSSVGFLKKSMNKTTSTLGYWDDKPIPEALLKDYRDYLARMNFDHMVNSMETKFDRIGRGIERIMKIVNSLRSFSRLDMETLGKMDINKSIEEAVDILNNQDAHEVEFIKEFREVPPMDCSPGEINQCLLHVLKNALDAVDHGGIIKIMTSYDEEEDQIIIRVVDNGKGMSPDIARQALNPFFTTKPVGTATGVGLSLTERIIKRHDGKVNISSKTGEGTTVTLTLPMEYNVL